MPRSKRDVLGIQKPEPEAKPTKVYIIESERGWGSKVDETREFSTRHEAEEFVKDFNSHNTSDTVPDWYMRAEIAE